MDVNFYSFIIATAVGVAAGYVGSLMVLKKMALVGDALSHVALPGLALGILLKFEPFIGAFAFLFVSAVLTWWLERATKLSFEAIIGTLFTLSLAIGILLVPEPDLLEALFGDISKVTLFDTVVAVIISISAIYLARIIYDKMILGIISEDLATSFGINIARVNLAYILLVSLIVAVGIKIVGTLLVGALVIVPAATAKNVSSNLHGYLALSSILGAACSLMGVLLSYVVKLPAGPLVVLSGSVIFIVAVIMKSIFIE